jgi:hypothetical protein
MEMVTNPSDKGKAGRKTGSLGKKAQRGLGRKRKNPVAGRGDLNCFYRGEPFVVESSFSHKQQKEEG